MKTLKFFTLFFLICSFGLQAKIVYIVPVGGLDPHKFFYEPDGYRDGVSKPFCSLREALENEGYTVKLTIDGHELGDKNAQSEVAALISLADDSPRLLSNLSSFDRNKCMIFGFDPPVVIPGLYANVNNITRCFGKVFLMFDDMVDNKKIFKMYYPQPELKMIEGIYDFDKKKLCTMIAGNKNFYHVNALYGERRKVIDFFEKNHPDQFDLYGTDWRCKSYKGTIPNKSQVLKKYKFSFCYENMKNQNGYITEKIFDSLVAGCVPIYFGASNIASYVPKECFIDRRDFSSEEDVYQFISNMNRETYERYIEAIRKYFASGQAQNFSIEHFIDSVLESIPSN